MHQPHAIEMIVASFTLLRVQKSTHVGCVRACDLDDLLGSVMGLEWAPSRSTCDSCSSRVIGFFKCNGCSATEIASCVCVVATAFDSLHLHLVRLELGDDLVIEQLNETLLLLLSY